MNSISRHLGFDNVVAVLKLLRSARRNDILLIVEGGTDASLFSGMLDLPLSFILPCHGKENLMQMFSNPIANGIDIGCIFLRDRDCFEAVTTKSNGIILLVTDRYDFEAEVLIPRLGKRILSEYGRGRIDDEEIDRLFTRALSVAAWIGCARVVFSRGYDNANFDQLNLKFVDFRALEVNVREMVSVVCNKSRIFGADIEAISAEIAVEKERRDDAALVCGKDLLDVMSGILHKTTRACKYVDCHPSILSKIMRIAACLGDFKTMGVVVQFCEAVRGSRFIWRGAELDSICLDEKT